jgi:hypothetical protein
MTQVADHPARPRVLTDLDSTLLVEAAAGTGKTALMAGRLTMLLARDARPGGLPQVSEVRHLSCPTPLARTIESQGVFSRLSHRLSSSGPNRAEAPPSVLGCIARRQLRGAVQDHLRRLVELCVAPRDRARTARLWRRYALCRGPAG